MISHDQDKSSTGLIGQNYAVLMEQERSSKGAVAGANGDQDRPADVVVLLLLNLNNYSII